jgi:uncharacterized protein (TIGR02117 family)
MKKILLSSIKSFLIFISGFLGLLLVYLSFAFILSIIPVNKNFTETKESGIVIYLLTNGVHLDIVVPKVSNYKDWREDLEINPFIDTQVNLVAFGWGDRDFYLNTPEWSDLTFSTAFNALFLKDSSAMHVSYFQYLTADKHCRKVYISNVQYLKIVNFIESSLYRNQQGQTICIENAGHNLLDQFYEANGTYHLFFTCNTWANKALKRSKLKACLWTPFDRGILWQYRQN